MVCVGGGDVICCCWLEAVMFMEQHGYGGGLVLACRRGGLGFLRRGVFTLDRMGCSWSFGRAVSCVVVVKDGWGVVGIDVCRSFGILVIEDVCL